MNRTGRINKLVKRTKNADVINIYGQEKFINWLLVGKYDKYDK